MAIAPSNLAELLRATNRGSEAEPLFDGLWRLAMQATGQIIPTSRWASIILAGVMRDTNRLGEAEPLLRRALAIDEASYGPDHPKVAIRLNNLAELLNAQPLGTGRAAVPAGAGDRRSELRAGSSGGGDGHEQPCCTIKRHTSLAGGGTAVSAGAGDRRSELRTGSSSRCAGSQRISRISVRQEPVG